MTLPRLGSTKKEPKTFELNIQFQATQLSEAQQMQQDLQSFVAHFNAAQLAKAAQKLKNPLTLTLLKNLLK